METEPSPSPSERQLPGGTVSFLFTDFAGSTKLVAGQREILRSAFKAHSGREEDMQGDAFFYSLARATEAVAAAVEAQRGFAAHDCPGEVEVRVRMGLHTGKKEDARKGSTIGREDDGQHAIRAHQS